MVNWLGLFLFAFECISQYFYHSLSLSLYLPHSFYVFIFMLVINLYSIRSIPLLCYALISAEFAFIFIYGMESLTCIENNGPTYFVYISAVKYINKPGLANHWLWNTQTQIGNLSASIVVVVGTRFGYAVLSCNVYEAVGSIEVHSICSSTFACRPLNAPNSWRKFVFFLSIWAPAYKMNAVILNRSSWKQCKHSINVMWINNVPSFGTDSCFTLFYSFSRF